MLQKYFETRKMYQRVILLHLLFLKLIDNFYCTHDTLRLSLSVGAWVIHNFLSLRVSSNSRILSLNVLINIYVDSVARNVPICRRARVGVNKVEQCDDQLILCEERPLMRAIKEIRTYSLCCPEGAVTVPETGWLTRPGCERVHHSCDDNINWVDCHTFDPRDINSRRYLICRDEPITYF